MKSYKFHILSLTTLLLLGATTHAEAKIFERKKKKAQTEVKAAPAKQNINGLKPYAQVITPKAKSSFGFLTVHKVDNNYFFEIPDSMLNRDILIVNRISKAPTSRQKSRVGYPGDILGSKVIRFENKDNKRILVREYSYRERSENKDGMFQSVRNSNTQPIVANFGIETIKKDSLTRNYVINVSVFLQKENPLFSFDADSKEYIGLLNMVGEGTYIDTLKAFPKNIEISTTVTYQSKKGMSNVGFLETGSPRIPLTYELNSSMVLLPEVPMKARLFDPRVGYFTVSYTDFDSNPQGIEYKKLITRWRLEPKDEAAYLRGELVEPKKPIIIYIDPATPKKWVPYLIQGVNDWQVAFEKAGFKNAIYALEAPTDDPSWSLEDARHSAIVYKPSDIPNASGPHINDPRTGEILETHINWYHNVMSLLRDWYMIQAGTIDEAARKMQLDDELMGQLIRFVSSHEVGHTLGLRHNFGSSHTVPVEKLRDKAWVEANGHTPSIMDYARFNYVAQPEDGITRAGIFPRIGIYDKWSIEWGYRWLPQFQTPEDEVAFSNQSIIEKLKTDVRYTFGTESDPNNPRNQSEDLGDDSMLASLYGIKNLKRIVPQILTWSYEPNKSYAGAGEIYSGVVSQFNRYLGHVTKNVAGIYSNSITVEQTDEIAREFVPANIQKRAIAFLNEQLFTTPEWLIDRQLMEKAKILPVNVICSLQSGVLARLINKNTLDKMSENEILNGKKAYTSAQMFNDLKKVIWSNLGQSDIYKRNMQKAYVENLINLLDKKGSADKNASGKRPAYSEAPAIAHGQLTELKRLATSAASMTSGTTKGHYQNLITLIDNALSNK
ncbi:zinc-dependent metalloprotease [Phocaeicola coprocola]|uniref:zinc-dependent metalloprotease n=1 Tax=Phocaeicola coprocola TaxID=310298 RepID=UPI001C382753|nr:zinc-dependent metalloprotease [Phocaeicola coprocola]MBV3868173.1 zinc-dependent metalloprotease [Phocaeicola coprocola]MBV4009325.1 zinc-dependent metalloprotease [Phocaeicola coprocola]MBV4033799.1 zinc-dependent metalloprotease [Phocaeicola coprocola]MBV4040378.1 zinc-dependent metalloprotease [Phocaeicola coprocola]MBV4061993.1 zinc-dependent metalloprotease [Phocaeicola coprocola]